MFKPPAGLRSVQQAQRGHLVPCLRFEHARNKFLLVTCCKATTCSWSSRKIWQSQKRAFVLHAITCQPCLHSVCVQDVHIFYWIAGFKADVKMCAWKRWCIICLLDARYAIKLLGQSSSWLLYAKWWMYEAMQPGIIIQIFAHWRLNACFSR